MIQRFTLILCLLASFSQVTNAQIDPAPSGKVDTISSLNLIDTFKLPILNQHLFFGNASSFTAFADGAINSTSLTGAFYKPFISGGHIDTETKGNVYNRLGRTNLIGGDINYGIRANFALDSFLLDGDRKSHLYFELSDRRHSDVRFRNNLFELAFYGNKGFQEDTVQMAGFNLNQLRYKYLKGGLAWSCNSFNFAAGAGLIIGNSFSSINVDDASLYTSSNGTEMALDIQAERWRSDTGNTSQYAFNGYGFGTEFLFEHSNPQWGTILVAVEDLGAIFWNDKSQYESLDTGYNYQGFYITNLDNLQDSIWLDNTSDSLTNATRITAESKAVTTFLPAYFHLRYSRYLSENISILSGVSYRINNNYEPLLFMEGEYHFNKWSVSSRFSYGGYGLVALGLGAECFITPKLYIQAQANNVLGWLAPQKNGGEHLALRLSYLLPSN